MSSEDAPDGLQQLNAMLSGELKAPIGEKLGFMLVSTSDGISFEDGPDRGRVLVSGRETGGLYSLVEFMVSARPALGEAEQPDFGPHRHNAIEETFLVRSGNLRFLLGEKEFDLSAGDLVRVPPGMRHGYANLSGREVDLLVTFHPGGFEQLFVTHRSDQNPPPSASGFLDDATRFFDSEFGI
jgi:mannose-6-phosphate isomerase-like protein (cupin superfamily)